MSRCKVAARSANACLRRLLLPMRCIRQNGPSSQTAQAQGVLAPGLQCALNFMSSAMPHAQSEHVEEADWKWAEHWGACPRAPRGGGGGGGGGGGLWRLQEATLNAYCPFRIPSESGSGRNLHDSCCVTSYECQSTFPLFQGMDWGFWPRSLVAGDTGAAVLSLICLTLHVTIHRECKSVKTEALHHPSRWLMLALSLP